MTSADRTANGPRRFLIAAAVTDYPKNRDWNRPGLLQAREKVVELFTGPLGYHLHDPLPLSPTRQQLTDALHAFCASPERREDDLLTVYLSCHGEILDDGEEHVLLTADTDPADLAYTALPTAELTRAMLRSTRIRRVMLLLDACYVGQGGNQMAAAALERLGAAWGRSSGSGLVVVSSAQPHQQATAGLFPKLLEEAVTGLSVAGHGPGTLSVNAVVQHINHSPDLPGYQRIGLAMVGLDGEPPAFFPNPRHDLQLNEVDLALQQAAAFDEQDQRRETEFTTRLLVRAMGYHADPGDDLITAPAWWFSGRHTALRALATWLNTLPGPDTQACRVVTAAPGSGKTAVLGLIAALAHPERRRTVPLHALGLPADLVGAGVLDAAVYAQRLTDTDILDAIAAAARLRTVTGTVGELLDALDHRPRPLTVLIDALDEAATPHTLCTTILRPLIEHSRGRIRLLLGTRPYLLRRLGIDPVGPDHVIDLDSPRYADHRALTTYTARTLLQARRTSPYSDQPHTAWPVAQAVATAAGHSFLIARITAGTLAATPTIPDPTDPTWRASLPRHAGDAMREDLHQRLGHHAERASDLLRPLAHAQGQGLPWEDIWAPLATEISGRTYTDDDLLWLRHEAGSYVVEATENDRSAYRLYHEAMAEHLREDTDHRAVHAAYVRVLTDRVPYRADGTRDWSRAHPYALNHLAHHAAQAGLLDQVLADAEYLVHAEPRGLTPHLHHAHDDTARLAAAVYRTGLHLHHDTTPRQRRQSLALDAARAGAHHLHHNLTRRIPPGDWTPLWATGSTFNPALRDTLTGHTNTVSAVACTVLDGRPVAVTASWDDTVRVWDLTTGRAVGEPLTGHTGSVFAVACTVLDGRPVAVTGSWDDTVRVWDLATSRAVGEPLTGHTHPVEAVACTVLDGRSVAVTGGRDGTVRVWDLATGRAVGEPLTGHTDTVSAVACTVLDGRPVAVTGSWDGTVRVWDLTTGRPLGEPLTGHTDTVSAVACTVLDGRPVAVTGGLDRTVRVWDLTTGRAVGEPLTGHTNTVTAVACTTLDGRPVVVTGSWDETVGVWDLATGRAVGQPRTGHTNIVSAVACTTLDGRPVVVTGGWDETVGVWDLATGRAVGEPRTGHTNTLFAVACTVLDGRSVAVTGGRDHTVRVWDLATGRAVGEPFTGHTNTVSAVACTVLDGRSVAVTGSWDGTVRVWDLATGRAVGEPLTGHTNIVYAVACTTLDGRPVAVTGGRDDMVRVWDLATGRAVGEPLTGHTDAVFAVACTVLDGRSVAVTGIGDGTVWVWDLATGRAVGEPLTGHTSTVFAVACTVLDGRPVAVTGSRGGTVWVWDLATGRAVGQPLTGHTGIVSAVACTVLDGRPVAVTGSRDNAVRVWDLTTGRAIAEILTASPRAVTLTTADDLVIAFHHDIALYRRQPHDPTTRC
ncbi:WD40 repeat domain-containing protein [Kitasatospora cinereorecta]|uniref:WD40 repeat domain-containing protein n=1 Tax=Kitasatospora cinereorecta TaxID=285560 RepID=A0ABW0VHN4_9ACTN